MVRVLIFFAAFVAALTLLPTVLEHHWASNGFNWSWCLQIGQASDAVLGFFDRYCGACLIFMGALGVMVLCPAFGQLRRIVPQASGG